MDSGFTCAEKQPRFSGTIGRLIRNARRGRVQIRDVFFFLRMLLGVVEERKVLRRMRTGANKITYQIKWVKFILRCLFFPYPFR